MWACLQLCVAHSTVHNPPLYADAATNPAHGLPLRTQGRRIANSGMCWPHALFACLLVFLFIQVARTLGHDQLRKRVLIALNTPTQLRLMTVALVEAGDVDTGKEVGPGPKGGRGVSCGRALKGSSEGNDG